MTKSILKVIVLYVISATASTVYCQTDWHSYLTPKPLPEKAKMKTVKYNSYGYAAAGYVIDKKFVEGQSLTFYNTKTETNYIPSYVFPINSTKLTNPIISGIYFLKDDISYIYSSIKQNYNKQFFPYDSLQLQAIFKISNTFDDKDLTVNRNDAKDLNVVTADIVKCSSFQQVFNQFQKYEKSTLLKNSDNNDYLLKIEFYDIPSNLTTQKTNLIIKELISFSNIYREKELEVTITFDYLKKAFFPNVDKLIKNSLIQNSNFPSTEQRISLNFYDFNNYIINSKDVRLKFQNGDVFVGKVEEGLIPNEGKYTFSNGEIFIGKLWEDGEWKFTDGSVENGDWIKKYDVSENDLSSAETLTDKHKLAIRIYEEKLQKEEIAKQQEEEKKQIKEQQEEEAIQKRRNDLINKYGEYYGTLLFENKHTLGMTKEMILGTVGFYDITINGNNEIWVLSIDRMLAHYLATGEYNVYRSLKLSLENLGSAGTEALLLERAVYLHKKIVFTNNKVTSISN